MNVWNLWKSGASRFHLQLASLKIDHEYIHVEGVLFQGPDPSAGPVIRGGGLIGL